MLKKFSKLMEYVTYLYKQNIKLQANSIFRVIKVQKDTNGENILDIQVINKSTIFKCTAKEIVAQDQLLECFSKSNIRAITYLATQELLKPKNKIIGYEYNIEIDKTLLKIVHNGSDKLIKITADKIANNSELLKDFNQEDAHKAGYLMAIEQMILEKKAIEKHKMENNNDI